MYTLSIFKFPFCGEISYLLGLIISYYHKYSCIPQPQLWYASYGCKDTEVNRFYPKCMLAKAKTNRLLEVRLKFNPKSHPPGETLTIQYICADQMCPVSKPSDPTQHQMVSNPSPLSSPEVRRSGYESGVETEGCGEESCVITAWSEEWLFGKSKCLCSLFSGHWLPSHESNTSRMHIQCDVCR